MNDKLDRFPRVGWRSKKAWILLQRARPFLLDRKDGLYFVQGGVTATPIDEEGRPVGPTVEGGFAAGPGQAAAGKQAMKGRVGQMCNMDQDERISIERYGEVKGEQAVKSRIETAMDEAEESPFAPWEGTSSRCSATGRRYGCI